MNIQGEMKGSFQGKSCYFSLISMTEINLTGNYPPVESDSSLRLALLLIESLD